MASQPIDYAALARQAGATSSTPGKVDYTALAKQAGATSSTGPPIQQPEGSALGRLAGGVWDTTVGGAAGAAKAAFDLVKQVAGGHIIDPASPGGQAITNLVLSHVDQARKAKESLDKGDYSEAFGHTLATVLPLIGPAAAHAGEKMGGSRPQYDKFGNVVQPGQAPDIAGGIGEAAGLVGTSVAPDAVRAGARKVNGTTLPAILKSTLNPVDQATVSFVDKEGVDVPLSFRTGSRTARNLEGSVQNEVGGAGYASKARQTTTDQMQRVGAGKLNQADPTPVTPKQAGESLGNRLTQDLASERDKLASRVHPSATTPEKAGAGVMKKFKDDIHTLDLKADSQYKAAWAVEKDPANVYDMPVTGKDGGPVLNPDGSPMTEKVAVPVDMRDVKDALEPLAKRYYHTLSQTDANASVGLKAMRQIIEGPDYQPASSAELDLSMLKEAARTEKGMAELRDTSQGLAAASVKELQARVDEAVGYAKGGDQALPALRAGRTATAQKYDVYDTAKSIFGKSNLEDLEPVQVFKRLTWGRDSGIEGLREIAKQAPAQLPEVGRAFIDSGGDWKSLGAETKKVLFRDPQLIRSLDQYFAKAQRLEPLTKLEPVKLFDRLTQDRDATIGLLQEVKRQAPQEIPKLGRAFAQGLLERTTREGDFVKVQGILNEWDNLGPEGKKILYRNPSLIKDLDNFFYSLKRLSENPNPSGSGYIVALNRFKVDAMRGLGFIGGGWAGAGGGAATSVEGAGLGLLAGQGMYALSNAGLARLLYNPKFTRLLTKGMQLQISGKTLQAATAAAQAARIATLAGAATKLNLPPETNR